LRLFLHNPLLTNPRGKFGATNMSESARKRQRTTPRNSEGPAETEEETLYGNVCNSTRDAEFTLMFWKLRQLAGIIPKPVTPYRRASSAGPTPGSRRTPNTLLRTPGTAVRTPRGGPATRPIPARRTAPTTPHAIRALRERANAARTPGVNRRRSGRVQRETPRDMLRALSRSKFKGLMGWVWEMADVVVFSTCYCL
jgi:hypothetical protein